MTSKRFDEVVAELQQWQNSTLPSKGGEYATEDRLHNFKQIANITGQTPMQVCYTLMMKHIVALGDKIFNREPMSQEFLNEKTGDPVNYLALLRGLYEDEMIEKGLWNTEKEAK